MNPSEPQPCPEIPRKHEVCADVVIDAPIERVWEVLVDFPRYGEWNPFISRIKGEAKEGSKLVEDLHLFEGMTTRMKARLVTVDSCRELAWTGHLLFDGFGKGTHHFELWTVDGGQVLVVQREKFSGFAVKLFFKLIKKIAEPQFRAMNAALKFRVEDGLR